jgi:hypothetical protein
VIRTYALYKHMHGAESTANDFGHVYQANLARVGATIGNLAA